MFRLSTIFFRNILTIWHDSRFCHSHYISTRVLNLGKIVTDKYSALVLSDNLRIRRFSSSYNYDYEFSGTVPLDKIEVTYSKSSGAGGQNVNKVNTKVEMRFHVNSAEWIPEWIRNEILKKESSKITKDGFLIIRSEACRTQLANQEDCIAKIKAIIYENSRKPYQPTEQELKVKERRLKKAKERILENKRHKSMKKQNRQSPGYGE